MKQTLPQTLSVLGNYHAQPGPRGWYTYKEELLSNPTSANLITLTIPLVNFG